MTWFCPSVGRPQRLKELAESWEKYASGRELKVRVWTGDPLAEEYLRAEWPKNWTLFQDDEQFLAPSLNKFFESHPDEDSYGFIADDVILTTPEGLEHLEALAYPFFVAYPNDTIQRHRKPTHFCVGGDLVRTMGWWVPRQLKHVYIDDSLKLVGNSMGLLRYAPQVIFLHQHPITRRVEMDDTYRLIYNEDGNTLNTEIGRADHAAFQQFVKHEALDIVNKVGSMLLSMEAAQLEMAGYVQESPVPDSSPEPVQGEGSDSGGMGGRDSAGAEEVSRWKPGRIHGSGPTNEPSSAVQRETVEERAGLEERRSAWVAQPKEYKYPDLDVVVCVPSTGTWQARTASSVAMNMANFLQHGSMPGVKSARIHLHTVESSMLSKNREEAVRAMMKMGRTHIFFVDSDMIFPENALLRLLNHDLPFVAANCTTREFPPTPTAHDFAGNKVASAGKSGLEVVRQVGLAIALIRRDVFMKTQPPHFLMDWLPQANGYCGEDIYFSQVLNSVGVDVVVDHDLSNEVGHIGWTIFGQGQVGCQPPPNWRIE